MRPRRAAWLGVVFLIVLVLALGAAAHDPIASAIRAVFAELSPAHVLVLAVLIAVLTFGHMVHRRRDPSPGIACTAGSGWSRITTAADEVPWPLSVGLIAAAAGVFWYSLGRALSLPRIFADEIIYAAAARSFAESGRLLGHGYGIVTPAVDAVAYLATGNDVDAYRLIQAINIAVMASAAFPAYLLARRALRHRPALGVAALTVFIPWMVYARFVMTEAAFYPIFLLFALALVRALERPSLGRQAILSLALAVAFGTRTQAVALAGAVVTSVAVMGLARHDLRSAVRAFAPTLVVYALSGACALALAASGAVRPLGAYTVLLEDAWHPRGLALWVAANVTSLSLGLGVLVVVAAPLGVAALLGRGATPGEQAVAAVAVSVILWMLLSIAVLSVSAYGQGAPHERNLFFVVPLVLTCAFAWAERGFPRPPLLTAATAITMIALAVLMPAGVITTHSIDALSFKLWAVVPRGTLSAASFFVVVIAVGSLIVVRLRCTWPLVASVALAAIGIAAVSDYRSPEDRSVTPRYGWVDRALPTGAGAAILWIGVDEARCPAGTRGSQLGKPALYTEYFNARVGPVGHLLGDNAERGLASEAFGLRKDGVVTKQGVPLRPDYVVTDSRVEVAGERVALLQAGDVGITDAREGSALALWRVTPPLRLRNTVADLRRRISSCAD